MLGIVPEFMFFFPVQSRVCPGQCEGMGSMDLEPRPYPLPASSFQASGLAEGENLGGTKMGMSPKLEITW